MSWSAKQYLAFEEQRTRPVRDLLAAVPTLEARRVVDIGCGPGNSTELLAARYPHAAIRGIDGSSDMIAAARKRLPDVDFAVDDIERWAYENPPDVPARFDVILANAVLHWVPDHARLLPALTAKLAHGGVLAVQMPDNLDEPAHVLMREIASHHVWRNKLAPVAATRTALPAPEWYYDLLRSKGCTADVWRTTYHHGLPGGGADVVEWFKGSGLRPFLAPLDDDERADFLARYHDAVSGAYPARADGGVLLPFPRLFIIAAC
jgi:trans-aconitate 2-methyltransferase